MSAITKRSCTSFGGIGGGEGEATTTPFGGMLGCVKSVG
jgi:hypothetical protein